VLQEYSGKPFQEDAHEVRVGVWLVGGFAAGEESELGIVAGEIVAHAG
jgi:hypothetical protein